MPPEQEHTKCKWGDNIMIGIVQDVSTIKQQLKDITDILADRSIQWSEHMREGDKQGGFRDRVVQLENANIDLRKQINEIKKGYWKVGIISGIICGLLVEQVPGVMKIIAFVIKTHLGV